MGSVFTISSVSVALFALAMLFVVEGNDSVWPDTAGLLQHPLNRHCRLNVACHGIGYCVFPHRARSSSYISVLTPSGQLPVAEECRAPEQFSFQSSGQRNCLLPDGTISFMKSPSGARKKSNRHHSRSLRTVFAQPSRRERSWTGPRCRRTRSRASSLMTGSGIFGRKVRDG